MPVITIALHGVATRFPDSALQSCDRQLLRGGSARHVKDLFLHDRAVEIVDAVIQRKLRQRQSHANPVGGQMIDVIEIDAADREITKLLKGRGRLHMSEDGCLRFKSKGNKSRETTGFVLQIAQLLQVIDPLGERLDVTAPFLFTIH
jgi:hypothetical protein